jgi:hypothetical protein
MSTIASEALSNAQILKSRMASARKSLFAAFISKKLLSVASNDQSSNCVGTSGGEGEAEAGSVPLQLMHVPAQDEMASKSSNTRSVTWSVSAAVPLSAPPARPPLARVASAGSAGSHGDGDAGARAAAIEAELATLPSAPLDPVRQGSGTSPASSSRHHSGTSERSAVLA